MKVRKWKVKGFRYSNPYVKPYFNGYARHFDDMYYFVDQSLTMSVDLLELQFDGDHELIVQFLTDVYNIVDKKIPERNGVAIISPPSAGKNCFFDDIASFFLNYGMFGTANKTYNCTWADGAGKRLVLWNNPNYEQYRIEKIKELLGGDTT